jgi:hydrogenase maturation protein HypF
MFKNVIIKIQGTVQGVGFRPFVYRVADELNIKGWVNNSSEGVTIEAEGYTECVDIFLRKIKSDKPVNSVINSFDVKNSNIKGFRSFEIKESDRSKEKNALILPDLATCDECLREIFNPDDRRYLYPFTNCTNCGPRFSIIEDIPYDREKTTMREFIMCDECRAEYENPLNRRFHAEPNACPKCGPKVLLYDKNKNLISENNGAINKAAELILEGKIIALKGLGGYQLIADARNYETVKLLRERKHREEKPFAMMFPSVEMIKKYCVISLEEEKLLASQQAPIVLLKKKENYFIAEETAPGNNYYGVMLPYTPLHHILMRDLNIPIIATSGNISDEPICINEEEAFVKLNDITDFFLVHNRKIVRQVDDSVAKIVNGKPFMIRRARGYAPYPVIFENELPNALAVGSHLKNTVAISSGKNIFISQHIGDLDTKEAFDAFKKIIKDFQTLYETKPEYVVCDLHPDYNSTKYAQSLGLKLIQVQHHYAHILSCIAENNIEGEVLGISWDGTGYGTDGNIWGGEFLKINKNTFERFAYLDYFRLPGGEKAIKENWRTGVSLLFQTGVEKNVIEKLYIDYDVDKIENLISKKINSPLTSSVGRLFDGISSIIGLKQYSAFEGQAAMQLEFASEDSNTDESYKFEIIKEKENNYIINWKPLINDIVKDAIGKVSGKEIAMKFHNTLAAIILEVCKLSGLKKIALSGGCFQNKLLLEKVLKVLSENNFEVYYQSLMPTNDGGICLGQMKYLSYLN